MVHENFHCIEASNPIALGHALGETFGGIVANYVDEARGQKDWQHTVDVAAGMLAVTNQYFPDLIAQLDAYAVAADIPLRDLWAMATEADFETSQHDRCTTVVTNQGRLIAQNEDWDADAVEDVCILKTICAGKTILEIYYYGCPLGGVALSVSSNGLIQAINSVDHADSRNGVPRSMIARAIAHATNAETALRALSHGPRASGFAHTVIDRNGQVVSLECSAARQVVSRPDLPFVHTNHYLQPEMLDVTPGPASASSRKRYAAARAKVAPEMTSAAIRELMNDRSAGRKKSICNASTIARGIIDLDQSTAAFWLRRENELGWIDYPIDFIF